MRIKTTFQLGLHLFGSALLGELMCFILSMIVSFFYNKKAPLGMGLVLLIGGTILFVGAVFDPAYKEGARDVNRIKNREMPDLPGKGFLAGLVANIPLALVITAYLICAPLNWHAVWFKVLIQVANVQYVLFLQSLLSTPWLLWLLCVPLPVISQISYVLGRHGVRLNMDFIYQKDSVNHSKKN